MARPLRLELAGDLYQATSLDDGRKGSAVNQFIASAAAEKMASVLTLDFLKAEAAKGRRSDFEHFMSLIPDTPAQPGDEIA
ncbi:MAG: toxin-antitoxin system HicB family antitoxin [Halothiobacillaceae bacterium]